MALVRRVIRWASAPARPGAGGLASPGSGHHTPSRRRGARFVCLAVWCAALAGAAFAEADVAADAARADESSARFAGLALSCVHREYPNKIAHVLGGDDDVAPPRELTPAFFGCYDWHSSVHGHWLLARLVRLHPDAPYADAARAALARSLTKENVAAEVQYLEGAGRASFERPYGLAWLLQLGAELAAHDDPALAPLSAVLEPLEREAAARVTEWIPKLTRPIRTGEHSQTAFAFGLMLDWARTRGDPGLERALTAAAARLYAGDRGCPIDWEPSGQDFLSPCLAEADFMRRVLSRPVFAAWLGAFLPGIPLDGGDGWLLPAEVSDRSDPKLAHLDGLNLARAWMLDGIASALPADDPRRASLEAARDRHADAGLAAVTGQHYEGGHWLGSFATYLVTRRGIE